MSALKRGLPSTAIVPKANASCHADLVVGEYHGQPPPTHEQVAALLSALMHAMKTAFACSRWLPLAAQLASCVLQQASMPPAWGSTS